MLLGIDFSPGEITFNDLDLDLERPLLDQIDILKEDLLQVNYEGNYIIDVGWYPEFSKEGSFKIQVIKDFDWINPELLVDAESITRLLEGVRMSISFIKEKL